MTKYQLIEAIGTYRIKLGTTRLAAELAHHPEMRNHLLKQIAKLQAELDPILQQLHEAGIQP